LDTAEPSTSSRVKFTKIPTSKAIKKYVRKREQFWYSSPLRSQRTPQRAEDLFNLSLFDSQNFITDRTNDEASDHIVNVDEIKASRVINIQFPFQQQSPQNSSD
jgi:hypothetical protein